MPADDSAAQLRQFAAHGWVRIAGAFTADEQRRCATFVVFPSARLWTGPLDGWHLDADYTGRLSPPKGLKVHAMFADVAPSCGGMLILSGSHRLGHRWFVDQPPRHGARNAELRKSVLSHPYLRDLCTAGNDEARLGRHDFSSTRICICETALKGMKGVRPRNSPPSMANWGQVPRAPIAGDAPAAPFAVRRTWEPAEKRTGCARATSD
jgi:hypothetical protein